MINLKYTVPVISAHTLISHSEKIGDDKYRFRLALDTDATASAVQMSQQDECAMLHMALELLKKNGHPQHVQTRDLSSVIVYIDFKGIFDRDPKFTKAAKKQKKAEAMFTSDGIELDFGLGFKRYLAFERSASMSRDCRLSFVCKDYLDELRERMMLGMTIGKCQLSKLYAYNGLMFTSGFRYEDKSIWNSRRIVVVDNPVTTVKGVDVITVEDDGSDDSLRRYRRVEQKTDVDVLEFDGEGLISFELADSIDNMYVCAPIHSSFQIRMPYIKGVVHKVDYKAMFRELGVEYIIDLWGERHNISDVDMILTKSMFKGFGWMTENGLTWGEYLKRCERYGHALYISGTNQLEPQTQTELNYQFITTASITAEEFRPLDLPDGWERSPEEDSRQWITKETEITYYNYLANPEFRKRYYLSALDLPYGDEYSKRKVMARILQKNERFINEYIYTKELEDRAASIVNKYAIGRLLISGDNRYLSGDLMRFMQQLVQTVVDTDGCYAEAAVVLGKECSTLTTAYAPGAAYPEQEIYTLLRNPHIARNEEVMVTSPEFIGPLREKYLSHLAYLIMVDSRTLIPERLGGADFDGDMIRTIADPLLNSCVLRNHDSREFDPFGFGSGIPLLKIPAAEPQIRDANDWQARFEVIKGTFSSRIGQICNAAFDRSVIAYDENSNDSFGEQCRQETETLAILTGLEIDSAKSGIKPDLTEYIGQGFARSPFLKYKDIVDDGKRPKWYEETKRDKLKRFFEGIDWDKVTSNVERLPYLALMLKENTSRIKPTPAQDSELFVFAQKDGWKDRLDPRIVEVIKNLIADYEQAKHRIRSSHVQRPEMTRKNDVERILFSRGQEKTYSADELYALYSTKSPEEISEMCTALREYKWHLMPPDKRHDFLLEHFYSFSAGEYFSLFCDFRYGGYRILWDIVCDYDDMYRSQTAKKKHFSRKGDSPELKKLLQLYGTRHKSDYKEDLAILVRNILREKGIGTDDALRCSIALGERSFAYEVLLVEVERQVATAEKKRWWKRS